MNVYACDFHIHIGQARGKPVKITASKNLTLNNVLTHALHVKGLDVITVIDGASDNVLHEVRTAISAGTLAPVQRGGWLYEDKLLVLFGAEVEILDPRSGRPAHFGSWFGDMESLVDFNRWLRTVQSNTSLSSQVARTTPGELIAQTKVRGGLFIVHHAFTPFRGVLGTSTDRLSAYFDDTSGIDTVELGLSADTYLADRIAELSQYTFVSNSDAHSLRNIAREHNLLEMNELSMREVQMALSHLGGRRILSNHGLYPGHGKYFRTKCRFCGESIPSNVTDCSCETRQGLVYGVYDRIVDIADFDAPRHPSHRPPYYHQVPLVDIPGVGLKTYEKLIQYYGSELAAQTCASERDLRLVVGPRLASAITRALNAEGEWTEGGAGQYGKLKL